MNREEGPHQNHADALISDFSLQTVISECDWLSAPVYSVLFKQPEQRHCQPYDPIIPFCLAHITQPAPSQTDV